ncbi:hypothetical protein BDW02DRAFT_597308 [Decorospora gaudefroyi]|uniref:DUF6594 domain-containing protein n=1 Tax=Decorospora gaudefroyi TaxID=184978 RepID=A0A6A5KDR7_9PLEO|nr:hypothetical protein BDW02DRAFT_597308 [Decorospora gaudefroyi]
MTTNHHPDWNSSEAPSVKDRIVALNIHDTLFERIAEFPEAAIKMRFGKESALASSYVEGEVFRCGRAAYSYIRENAKPGKIIENDVEFRRVMDDLVNILLRYGLVHENSKRLNWSPSPSNVFMRMFRISNRTGPGNDGLRAANGEMTLMYRQEGEPIPFYLMAEDNEDLEPMAQFVMVWLMNPVNDWIIAPAQRFWHRMPFYPRKRLHGESDDPEAYGVDVVNSRTLSAVANALVYVIAILILLAPIATFNTIQGQTLRIAIMPFFCLVLVGAAQLMGSSTTPMFTLVTTFFQVMTIYVATSE